MQGAWLAPLVAKLGLSAAKPVLLARQCFLACIVAGLIQKPMIIFAWDVQTFRRQLGRVQEQLPLPRGGGTCFARRASQLLGGTAVLLRHIFAVKGQQAVGDIAVALAVAGRVWDATSLKRLLKTLDEMSPEHTMKRRGHMAQHTGPKWVRGLCSDAFQLGQFHRVSDLLGDLLTSKVLKSGAFDEVCTSLKQKSTS